MTTPPSFEIPTGAPPTLTPGVMPDLPGVAGDESAVPARENEPTDLASLLAELDAELLPQEETWEIPTRPGWAARYRTDISDADMKQARRSARVKGGKRSPDGEYEVDELKVGRILLAKYNTGIFRNGVLVEDEQGPVTFRSGLMLGLYKVQTVEAVVGKLYGTDGAVISAGRVLLNASGWLDDPESVGEAPGPTDG